MLEASSGEEEEEEGSAQHGEVRTHFCPSHVKHDLMRFQTLWKRNIFVSYCSSLCREKKG